MKDFDLIIQDKTNIGGPVGRYIHYDHGEGNEPFIEMYLNTCSEQIYIDRKDLESYIFIFTKLKALYDVEKNTK